MTAATSHIYQLQICMLWKVAEKPLRPGYDAAHSVVQEFEFSPKGMQVGVVSV